MKIKNIERIGILVIFLSVLGGSLFVQNKYLYPKELEQRGQANYKLTETEEMRFKLFIKCLDSADKEMFMDTEDFINYCLASSYYIIEKE